MLRSKPTADQHNQNVQEPGLCTFSKHSAAPLSPTNDPDDGLASGTGAEDWGPKAVVFPPQSLRDAEGRRLQSTEAGGVGTVVVLTAGSGFTIYKAISQA